MPQLIAIAYGDETLAGRAAEEVARCVEELPIEPDATSVVICERDASVRLTTSRRPGATASWSRFWSLLVDVVTNGDPGAAALDRDFSAQLRAALRPGTSALLIATSCKETVLEALSPFGGQPIACALPGDLPSRWGVAGLTLEDDAKPPTGGTTNGAL